MRYGILLLFTLAITINTNAQGIEFFQGNWEEALAKAEAEDKLIFVDAYASWCGPCKRMSANVFPDQRVGEFYNQHFVSLKWDMEKDEHGIKFRQKFPVSAFPTLFYIDFTGEVVQQIRGAQMVDQFIDLGRQALSKVDRSDLYAKDYEAGDRSPKLVYSYIKALNKAGKASQPITNDFLRTEFDPAQNEHLKIVFEGTVEADSKAFELLVEHRDRIEQLLGKEAVQSRVISACKSTVDKAVEFNTYALLEDAQKLAKKHCPEQADAFIYRSDMDYALNHLDAKLYLKSAKSYLKKVKSEDADAHAHIATAIARTFNEDAKAMSEAEKFAEKAAKLADSYEYYYSYAVILNQNGKKAAALAAARKSLEKAKEQGATAVRVVENFIRKMEQG